MKALTSMILVVLLAAPVAGCLVRTRDRHHHHHSSARKSCGPAHHWNGDRCVHNGNGKGNGKGRGAKVRDHRR